MDIKEIIGIFSGIHLFIWGGFIIPYLIVSFAVWEMLPIYWSLLRFIEAIIIILIIITLAVDD